MLRTLLLNFLFISEIFSEHFVYFYYRGVSHGLWALLCIESMVAYVKNCRKGKEEKSGALYRSRTSDGSRSVRVSLHGLLREGSQRIERHLAEATTDNVVQEPPDG